MTPDYLSFSVHTKHMCAEPSGPTDSITFTVTVKKAFTVVVTIPLRNFITRGGHYVRALLETGKYVLLNNSDICEGGPFTRFDPAHPNDDDKKSSLDLVIISKALLPFAYKFFIDSKSQYGAVRATKSRGHYIGTSSEVLAIFDFTSPEQKLTAIQTYCCSSYGSMLWDFYSDTAEKTFRSWSTTVKIAHNLPRHTRTYIMEHYLSGSLPSVRQMILRRYVQFLQGLLSSSNPAVCHLANLAVATNLSVTGRNVSRMREEFGRDPVTCHKREFVVDKCQMPEDGEETIELLERLLEQRSNEEDEDVLN